MTFSITARCERTGQLGIAISTKVIGVGARCVFTKAKVGAIASQASSNPYLGINGLNALREGLSADAALEKVLAQDPAPSVRQVAVVDHQGNTAVHTGADCVDWFGHITGDGFVAMGNMLVGEATITEMAATFTALKASSLAERLMAAIEAGQAAGGDKRGRQSAAIVIVDTEDYPYLDLRVDEHPDPIKELRRIYELAKEQLIPRMELMPTKANPAGINDLTAMKKIGLISEEEQDLA